MNHAKMPCRSQRPIDNRFDTDELLFRRVLLSDLQEDGHPYPPSFKFPVSVNRSRYSGAVCVVCSCPCDLRHPSADYVPLEIKVSDVICHGKIRLKHSPTERNCSHSDLHTDPVFRKAVRTRLSDYAVVVSNPNVCEHFVPKQ